jgi:hypothetical protein
LSADPAAPGPRARRPLARRLLARGSLPLAIGGCWLLASWLGTGGLERQPGYLMATNALLAVGLYGSTYAIDLGALRTDRWRVLLAVTIGVLFKAVLIGAALYAVSRQPVAFVLGIAVAQIDPLAVASIMGNDRLSPRAKAILASWASFDDPVTVILSVYATTFAAGALGLDAPRAQFAAASDQALSYVLVIGLNLGFAAVVAVGWRVLRRWPVLAAGWLVGLGAVAIWQFLALGVAIAGLVVRPAGIGAALERTTRWALLIAAGLLGALLAHGIDPVLGAVLGVAAFGAQIVAGVLLTGGLPAADRAHLALAQQNGITAIILALRIEIQYPGAVAVIGPAIVVVNVVHALANRILDADRRRRAPENAELP